MHLPLHTHIAVSALQTFKRESEGFTKESRGTARRPQDWWSSQCFWSVHSCCLQGSFSQWPDNTTTALAKMSKYWRYIHWFVIARLFFCIIEIMLPVVRSWLENTAISIWSPEAKGQKGLYGRPAGSSLGTVLCFFLSKSRNQGTYLMIEIMQREKKRPLTISLYLYSSSSNLTTCKDGASSDTESSCCPLNYDVTDGNNRSGKWL